MYLVRQVGDIETAKRLIGPLECMRGKDTSHLDFQTRWSFE